MQSAFLEFSHLLGLLLFILIVKIERNLLHLPEAVDDIDVNRLLVGRCRCVVEPERFSPPAKKECESNGSHSFFAVMSSCGKERSFNKDFYPPHYFTSLKSQPPFRIHSSENTYNYHKEYCYNSRHY